MKDQYINDLQLKLVNELNEKKLIRNKHVENAFLTVPRHLFLPGVEPEKVYTNSAIVTKWNGNIPISSSSEPAVYAIMLEQLEIEEGLKILEIGAGTGFNAALMAEIVGSEGNVITVDIDNDITDSASKNLKSAGYDRVRVVCKDGSLGHEPDAPYDRIIVTAGVWDISPDWFKQLKPGGILLLPIVINIKDQMTIAFRKIDDHLESSSISGCKFMELRGSYNKPVSWIEVGLMGQELMLCSGHVSRIKKDIFYTNSRKDLSSEIKVTDEEIHTSLLPWLEMTEEKFCFLVSSIETTNILNLPILPGYKRKSVPMLIGFAENERACFLNFIEEENADNETSKLFKLHISNFGSDEKLGSLMIQKLSEWNSSGRPGIKNVKVKAYFGESNITPGKDEHLINKASTNLLFSFTKK